MISNKKYFYPSIYIGMTVKALYILEEINRVYGGTLRKHRDQTEKWAEAWMLDIHGAQTRKILEDALPFLRLKERQARILLRLMDDPKKGPELYAEIRDLNRKGPPRKKKPYEDRGTTVRFAGDRMVTPRKNPDIFSLSGWEQWSGPWTGSGILWGDGECSMLDTTEWPSAEDGYSECSLAEILEPSVAPKYLLSAKACEGIIRRAEKRGKKLPERLRVALEQAASRGPTGPVPGT